MRYLSVCSGIEAASVAWTPLGFEPVAFSEIESFPCAVLKHHYPKTLNLGDITKFKDWPDYAIDTLVGGTPCQSFSVAGLRKGLADPRGNLALTFLAIVERYAPRWVVWENVPGLLSSDYGQALGAFLGGLGQLGYGFAYRILDAQYFGLAQRRKRVFVVGHSGGQWQRAAAVLFERESLCGHPAPSRETGQRVANAITERPDRGGGNSEGQRLIAPTLSARTKGGGGLGTDFDLDGGVIPIQEIGKRQSGTSMNGVGHGEAGDPMFTLQSSAVHGVCAFQASDYKNGQYEQESTARGLTTSTDRSRAAPIIAFSAKDSGADAATEIAPTLRALNHDKSHANSGWSVAIALPLVADCLQERDSKGSDSNTKAGHLIPFDLQSCSEPYTIGHADATEAHTVEILHALRIEIGEKAYAEWGLGVLVSFWPQEILQSAVHGTSLRCPTVEEFGLVNYALSCSETGPERLVREMRETKREGCPPFGWEPHEQRTIQLAAYLSKLSHHGASGEKVLRDLWAASQGTGILRDSLPTVQEVGRSDVGEGQSVHGSTEGHGIEPTSDMLSASMWASISRAWTLWKARNSAISGSSYAVRRLSPTECSFLQGFPRGYLDITYRGKPAADGPKYKALGNSMATPVVRWIGERIALVDKLSS